MANRPHVVVIPYPAQGHVMPLMKLSCCLADQGFRVTFVNTESIHAKLMDSLPEKGTELSGIEMVALPDGHTPEERNDTFTAFFCVPKTLPSEFEKLITKIMQSSEGGTIKCVITDVCVGWALQVAQKIGIRQACFVPASAATQAICFNVPKLFAMGVIDDNGTVKKNERIILSPHMLELETTKFMWNSLGDSQVRKNAFQVICKNVEISLSADWLLCNSSDQLEKGAISSVPNFLAVGPLLASKELGTLWPEDSTCISWLNQQANNSVVYIAFGSHAIFNKHQFDELAIGLELLGKPFLWVVREDATNTIPEGFLDRIADYGKVIAWAPQQKVLAHPSIACFVCHCGWNSTMDGVSMGVPFICWPFFGDQFIDATYITDVWKVGLELNRGDDGIVSRDELKSKVEQLLGDKGIRENALKLKEAIMSSIGKGGSSSANFQQFVEEMKH